MNAQIREEAARWLIEFRTEEPDATARQEFAAWLRASPENVEEYLRLTAVWEEGGQAPRLSQPDLEELIRLACAGNADVVDLTSAQTTASGAHEAHRATAHRYLMVAAAASIAIAVTIAAWFLQTRDRVYATELGEQRTIALADGSTVELNALSSIRVHVTQTERRVDLVSGQALFRVIHDAARPFLVRSGAVNVRDLGTEFDVARGVSGTTVTVLAGRVAVQPLEPTPGAGSATPGSAVELIAGEQLTVAPRSTSRAPPRPQKANLAVATGWTQQQLVFDSTPLAQAAEEFNRFNARPIHVEAAGLEDFHVSGTFPARDPASLSRFILFLREQPGIQVHESGDEILVRQK